MGRLFRYIRANLSPVLFGAGGMLVLLVILVGGEAALSTKAFCTSCHSMSYPEKELARSGHYGPLGVDPECKQCHIPQGLTNIHLALWSHIADGSRDLIAELTNDYSTRKLFDERRLEMAHTVRMSMKKQDSLTCRACHKNPRAAGRTAKAAHERMQTEGATCIDCHQNLVHREVDETDLDASLAAGEMVIREEE